MVELTEKQVKALKITQAALVQIRALARQPVTPTTMAAIHDLADALHNVPLGVTMRPKNMSLSTVFDEELDRDIETATGVFWREGFPLFVLPPDTQISNVGKSAYVASGARFWIPPGIADRYATSASKRSRRGKGAGWSLAHVFRRFFR